MNQLSYGGFVNVVKRTLPVYLGEDYSEWEVSERTNYRINEKLHTLNVMPSGKEAKAVSPNIYLENYYEEYVDGRNIYVIVNEMADNIKNVSGHEALADTITKDSLLKCTVGILINAKINEEYLEHLPHRRFLDLAVAYRAVWGLKNHTHLGTMITNEMIDDWEMTEEELNLVARQNRKGDFAPKLLEVNNILTITNNAGVYGAIHGLVDLDILKEIAEYERDNLYVIPSSIHEVFVVPKSKYDLAFLKNAAEGACEAGVLRECDFLSANIYQFNREEEKVVIARE